MTGCLFFVGLLFIIIGLIISLGFEIGIGIFLIGCFIFFPILLISGIDDL